jgi:hypothetical protein
VRRRGRARQRPVLEKVRASAAARGVRGPTAEGNYGVCCPYCPEKVHREDDGHKLTVKLAGATREGFVCTPEAAIWNCYRCGSRGVADFSWLLEVAAAPPAADAGPGPPPDMGPPEGFATLDDRAPAALAPYVEYLARRGVLAQARAAGAGACAVGTFRRRVVLPMRDATGTWTGFSARAVDGREPKYLYPAGMDRRRSLWGLEHLPPGGGPVWLVEGVFDALPLFPHALAAFGKNVTDDQLDALARLGRPVVACLDGDAWEMAWAVAGRLQLRGVRAAWCRLPPATDPGQLGWEVARHIVAQ